MLVCFHYKDSDIFLVMFYVSLCPPYTYLWEGRCDVIYNSLILCRHVIVNRLGVCLHKPCLIFVFELEYSVI